jgi:integrase
MGLYRRGKIFWFNVTFQGRRIQESLETSNKKLAEQLYAKKVTDMVEGRYFDKKVMENISMGQVMDRFLDEISPHLAKTTHARNRYIVQNLKHSLGSLMIGDVTPSIVSKYKAARLKIGKTKETVIRELGVLRRIFNIAINEWEYCKDNPASKVMRTLGKADNKRVRYLTSDETSRLYLALPSWLRPIVTIARHTGLRRTNIIELTWDQVNFKNKVLTVSKTKNGEPIGIPLTETALETLSARLKIRHLRKSFVFCDGQGNPFTPDMVTTAFRRACRRAAIENFRFHDLRHDFASKLIQSGVDIYTIRELLGHKDLRMTVRYSHLAPENLRTAVSVLDEKEGCYNSATVGNKKRVTETVTP